MTKNQNNYKPVPVYNRKLVRAILKKVNQNKNGQHKVSKMMHIDFSRFHKHEETVDCNKKNKKRRAS